MSFKNFPDFFLNSSDSEMDDAEKLSYRFKSFRLDLEERRLLRHGDHVPPTPLRSTCSSRSSNAAVIRSMRMGF